MKPTYEMICILNEACNIDYKGSLKDSNKLSFSLPFFLDGKKNENVDKVQTDYIIECELYEETTGLVYLKEYFLINDLENVGDQKDIKEVSCISLEYQLANKLIKNYSGSKKIYRTPTELAAYQPTEQFPTYDSFRESGVLNTILRLAPSWKIGSVDDEINSTFREFDIDVDSVLNFLLNTAQSSFNCVFFFDSVEKTISAKAIDHLGTFKGFLLSENSYIKSITETINIDDIVSKLYVYGKDNLDIRQENILGEEYILDLSYYRNSNFMSQSLLDSLDNYDLLISNKRSSFDILTANLKTYSDELTIKNTALISLQTELEDLEKSKDDLIANEEDLSIINSQIDSKNTAIETVTSEITTFQSNVNAVTADIEELQLLLLMESNFNPEEIEQIDVFIKEKEIRNDSITDTAELYEFGLKALQRNKQPCVQFDLDIVSLFDCVECQADWDKVKLADTAYIKCDRLNIDIELRIISYQHNAESNKLNITFGNYKDLNDPNMLIEELKSSIAVSTSLDINKNRFLDYVNSGDKTKINQYITSALDLSRQKALAGKDQCVSIDQRGVTLTDPSDANNQVRLMNDLVAFTKDGWQTSSLALSAKTGVVAEAVYGKLGAFATVAADQIVVGDYGEGLSEEVLGDKVVLQNAEYNRVTINTDDGIKALHPADNSYTQMNGNGFLRFIPTPIYTESPLSPDVESFNGYTDLTPLINKGWEFSTCAIDSNRLRVGNLTGTTRAWARINKYITHNNTTFNFSYTTAADGYYYFYIDNTKYNLSNTSTSTTFQTTIGGTVTLNKGWHTFVWYDFSILYGSQPDNLYMYIDDIVFEQSPVIYTPSGTYDITGSSYNYLTYSGTGSTPNTAIFTDSSGVPDVWVQLPDEFKGKNFSIDVFLQDTGEEGADYAIGRILVEVVKDNNGDPIIDYTNARFKVRARLKRTYYSIEEYLKSSYPTLVYGYRPITISYWRGCDFNFICRC